MQNLLTYLVVSLLVISCAQESSTIEQASESTSTRDEQVQQSKQTEVDNSNSQTQQQEQSTTYGQNPSPSNSTNMVSNNLNDITVDTVVVNGHVDEPRPIVTKLDPNFKIDAHQVDTYDRRFHELDPCALVAFDPAGNSLSTLLKINQSSANNKFGTIEILTRDYNGNRVADCTSASCEHRFKAGTEVVLRANDEGHSVFDSWGGSCEGSENICKIQLGKCQTLSQVSANYTDNTPLNITIKNLGVGHGSVQVKLLDQARSYQCDQPECSYEVNRGEKVELSASADPETSMFSNWSDSDCGSSLRCIKTISSSTQVSANFDSRHSNPKNGDLGNWKCSASRNSTLYQIHCYCSIDTNQQWGISMFGGLDFSRTMYGEHCKKGLTGPAGGSFQALSISHDGVNRELDHGEELEIRIKFQGSSVTKEDFRFDFTGLQDSSGKSHIKDKKILGDELILTFVAPDDYSKYYQNDVLMSVQTAYTVKTTSLRLKDATPADGDGIWRCSHQTEKQSYATFVHISCVCSTNSSNTWKISKAFFGGGVSGIYNDTVNGQKCK